MSLLLFSSLWFNSIFLGSNIHKLTRCGIKICLHLLQISTLSEQSFTNCAALVLKDLLPFKVSTFSSLHEFISVVLIPCLKMKQRSCHCLDFFFTFFIFGIKLITITLKFFSFLGSFYHIINLWVLTNGFCFPSCWFIFLNKALVFNS